MHCQYVETRAGDTLYILSNFVHVAEATSSEPSMHITFGLQEEGRRWKDIILLSVKSVVCFWLCDDRIVNVINDAVYEISNQKRGKHLHADRYKWSEAFPLWKCAALSTHESNRLQADETCSQQFV